MAKNTIIVNGVEYERIGKVKAKSAAKPKGTTLERFADWCSRKGFEIKGKKAMEYTRQDKSVHKGLLVSFKGDTPDYYVFEHKWGQVTNCTLDVKV